MSAEFVVTLPRIPVEDARASAVRAMRGWGQSYLNDLRNDRLHNQRTGRGLARRTGNLANGWNSATTADSTGAELRIWISGPGAKYAGLQEDGGTVRPTHSKYLWIPLDANKTPAGITRMSPREAIQRGGFFINSRKGGKVFMAYPLTKAARKKNGADNLIPLFALKKSVYVPAKMGAKAHFASKMNSLADAIRKSQEAVFA